MSKLLINEYPLLVLPSLAVALGINAAIITQQIHYWISDERAPVREGKRWHYATYEQWGKQFPWISIKQIKRIILQLESKNILISSEFNKSNGNRTKWYTINYNSLESIDLKLNNRKEKSHDPLGQNDPIIETKWPALKKETNKETKDSSSRESDSNTTSINTQGQNSDLIQDLERIDYSHKQAVNLITRHGEDKVASGIKITREKATSNPKGFLNTWLASKDGINFEDLLTKDNSTCTIRTRATRRTVI